ncbi:hypothetical protein [Halalkalicoccus tibetensis]|uniref:Cytochrome b/b6 N-terminal region profile domain-containing protein n=1 Tax=Halalkalicoccus tibetensis TaxID=175632 RepID=A0ABD5V7V8_9EURY
MPSPESVSATPAQYAAAWYVPVAGALFVLQALTGALLAHYYVECTGFFGLFDAFGVDVVSWLPFATVRTWHINLAVLWITTLWLAGGLFLPGLFSDEDPPGQAAGTTALLGLLVVATLGAFAGVWLGTHGKLGSPEDGELWWWLGSEGLEYLEDLDVGGEALTERYPKLTYLLGRIPPQRSILSTSRDKEWSKRDSSVDHYSSAVPF